MKLTKRMKMKAAAGALLLVAAVPAMAQYDQPPALLAPEQLDTLVSRIALYPDPLLAQVLAAATFPNDIPDAARWAYEHEILRGNELAQVIAEANLPWDPSVQSLLPFPDVLDMMARDMDWTAQLGDAFLAQRDDVMDAVQRMRRTAENYGYLQSNGQIRVIDDPGYIQIEPYDPAVIYVPVYDPYIVYAPPRPGFYVGTALGFPRGFAIGVSFGRWGWGGGFNWRSHGVIVHDRAWNRTWANRHAYAPHRDNIVIDRRPPVGLHRPVTPPARFENSYRPPANDRNWNRGNENRPAPRVPARVENTNRPATTRGQFHPAPQAPRPNAPARQENIRRDAGRGDRGGSRPAGESHGGAKGMRR